VNRTPPPDAAVRAEVLDPTRSFLVRAPAGSGKTELLVRRVLGLLAHVDEPEEVLAITFTRKAAGEMRRRVLAALAAAAAGGEDPLATAALARDAARGWGLVAHPARLRIQTIDALNAALAGASPVTAGASGLRTPVDRPAELYAVAARHAFELVAGDDELAAAAGTVLRHFDNRLPRAVALVAAMLGRRDQWLPVLGSGAADPGALRAALEAGLRTLLGHRLDALDAALPAAIAPAFRALTELATARRGAGPELAAGDPLARRRAFWRAAAITWLTEQGDWRQRLDKNVGFPPDDADAKQRAKDLLDALAHHDAFRTALTGARRLPAPAYADGQWRVLAALVRLLPAAAAALRVEFAASGATDFVELATEALAALAGEGGTVARRLDARLRHLLIDEFQDTSRTQHRLLDALTTEFVPGDGRTVFLVGDPMQSIYRFREAEVGLFMALAAGAPGRLGLEVRTLRANFRSVPAVVDWVNTTFERLLPGRDDGDAGAAAFAPAVAVQADAAGDGVCLHAPADAAAEADAVVALVAGAQATRPGGTIGILVRSRAHAAGVLARLEAAGIAASAVELRRLGETTLAHDILALTRALTHPADRLAWLAVLRAPWCGLALADLEALVGDAPDAVVPELLADAARVARLGPDGQARVTRLQAAFARAAATATELDLRDRVEGLWNELGGPACTGAELALADDVFGYLDAVDAGGDCRDALALAALLRDEPVRGRAGAAVEVLTIHKAKGLEFDTVIVPGLGNRVRGDSRPPLLWRELPVTADLLLAPINAAGAASDDLYELLWELAGRQAAAELDRLLYVACTRARRCLHLLGTPGDEGPARGSLLARLAAAVPGGWPPAASSTDAGDSGDDGEPAGPASAAGAAGPDWTTLPLRRLAAGFARPVPPPALPVPPGRPAELPAALALDGDRDRARRVGVVIHRLLQYLAAAGSEAWPVARVAELQALTRHLLTAEGLARADLAGAAARVEQALATTLADATGRWVLSGGHPEAASEFALTWVDAGRTELAVMDRTLLTAAGERWVVDYKTGAPGGEGVDAFLAAEAGRHGPQLARYRRAWQALGTPSVRLALYFPVLGRLLELDPPTDSGSTA
jgi:ATP-dependent exoDNAse (exonuclease V) beta subunit